MAENADVSAVANGLHHPFLWSVTLSLPQDRAIFAHAEEHMAAVGVGHGGHRPDAGPYLGQLSFELDAPPLALSDEGQYLF